MLAEWQQQRSNSGSISRALVMAAEAAVLSVVAEPTVKVFLID